MFILQTLTSLTLSHVSLSSEGAKHLADALKVNQVCVSIMIILTAIILYQTVTTLNLDDNWMSESGIEHLAAALTVNHVRLV